MAKPAPSGDRLARLLLGGALLLCLFLYAPVRHMFFFFDDRVTILNNEKIHSPSWISVISENPFRLTPNLTFALQLRLHRPFLPAWAMDLQAAAPYLSQQYRKESRRNFVIYTDPRSGKTAAVSVDQSRGRLFPLPPAWPFRLANIILHAINAILLYSLLRRLAPEKTFPSALAAAAFLLHPLATETVNYITARFTLLGLTFSLGAAFFHFKDKKNTADHFLFGLFFLLALLSKETSAVLPLILFLLEAARGRLNQAVLGWLGLSAVYFLLRLHWPIILGAGQNDVLPWYKYLLVEQRVWWIYIAKVFFPLHLNFEYHLLPRTAPDAFFVILNLSMLAAAGFMLFPRLGALQLKKPTAPPQKKSEKPSRKAPPSARTPKAEPASLPPGRWPAVIFLAVFLLLAPTSSVIPLADLVKEDRAYPLLAVCLPGLFFFLAREKRLAAGPIAVSLLYALLAWNRNQDWRTELSLTADSLRKSPAKPRAVYNYATALKWSGDLKKALRWYENAYALDPQNLETILNLEGLKRTLTKNQAGQPVEIILGEEPEKVGGSGRGD